MSDEELAAMPDEECERLALHLSVLDANWRHIGLLAQVLKTSEKPHVCELLSVEKR